MKNQLLYPHWRFWRSWKFQPKCKTLLSAAFRVCFPRTDICSHLMQLRISLCVCSQVWGTVPQTKSCILSFGSHCRSGQPYVSQTINFQFGPNSVFDKCYHEETTFQRWKQWTAAQHFPLVSTVIPSQRVLPHSLPAVCNNRRHLQLAAIGNISLNTVLNTISVLGDGTSQYL